MFISLVNTSVYQLSFKHIFASRMMTHCCLSFLYFVRLSCQMIEFRSVKFVDEFMSRVFHSRCENTVFYSTYSIFIWCCVNFQTAKYRTSFLIFPLLHTIHYVFQVGKLLYTIKLQKTNMITLFYVKNINNDASNMFLCVFFCFVLQHMCHCSCA